MKYALALAALLFLVALPAFAEEGEVPRATLASLGLGDMQRVSDAQGMQVRGRAFFFSRVRGVTAVAARLYEPDDGTYHLFGDSASVDVSSTSTGTLSPPPHTITFSWSTPVSAHFATGTVRGLGSLTISHP